MLLESIPRSEGEVLMDVGEVISINAGLVQEITAMSMRIWFQAQYCGTTKQWFTIQ
jgi:hypothetical protein